MKGDTGPHVNAQWLEGCPQWLERYDYIVARSEAYFDHYRANPAYDFTKTGGAVDRFQTATENAYKKYAEGLLTIEGVGAQVRMLKDAFLIR